MKTITFGITDNEEVCANCKHYHMHYIKDFRGMTVCMCGHCVYPRIKHRKPYDTCKKFEQGEN
jgi:hypothetical protein